ncbi:MAG: hypothetical protein K8F25_04445 [Fimbriimonadaceae bacterium]|nr:hypothetical protein [Alphaproteobacteria bacterium]
MTALDDSQWDVVRRAYESGDGRVVDICRRFDLTKTELYNKIDLENWTPRRQRKHAGSIPVSLRFGKPGIPDALRQVLGADIAPSPDHVADRETTPRIYIRRLYALVAHQIGLIEARRGDFPEGAELQPASDAERMSRTLSTLVRALEKLIELEDSAAPGVSAEQEGHSQANADQLRIELARRIARLEQAQPVAVSGKPDDAGT